MMSSRLPTSVEVSALIRLVETDGGFGMVLRKGEPDSGTILLVILNNQGFRQSRACAFERMTKPDGKREWLLAKEQDVESNDEFEAYLARRMAQDRDLWVVELTVVEGEQFIWKLNQI